MLSEFPEGRFLQSIAATAAVVSSRAWGTGATTFNYVRGQVTRSGRRNLSLQREPNDRRIDIVEYRG
jgi:hypothetical protein